MAAGTEIAKLYATIGADSSGLKNALDSTHISLQGLSTGFSQLQSYASVAFKAIGAAAAAAGAVISATGFEFNAMKEQANIAFTTMLGSGLLAQDMLDKLQEFAAKTPFEFPDLIRASQRMMAMGFTAQEVIPTLTAVGDAVAALGGGQAEIDRVTTALGQMNAKGKTSAEEMMQLTEAGIPAWQMLADKIGTSVPEAMKMVSAGAVTAKTTISAVLEGVEERFGGMMAAQSKTWNGLLSNLKDNFTQASGTIMKPFFEFAKQGLEKLVVATTRFNEVLSGGWGVFLAFQNALYELLPLEIFDRWNYFRLRVEDVYVVLKALITPILNAAREFVRWSDIMWTVGIIIAAAMTNIVVAMAPVIVTVAALVAAVAAMRWAWENDFKGMKTAVYNSLNAVVKFIGETSGIWIKDLDSFLDYLDWFTRGGWKNYFYFPIRSFLIELRNDIALWVLMTKNGFSKWVTDVGNTVNDWKNKVVDKFGDWRNVTQNTIAHWVDYVLDKFGHYSRRADTIFTLWKNTMRSIAEDWRDDFLRKWQDVQDWFDRHIQPWIQKGRDLMQGLWDGAKEVWNRFKSWWDGIWSRDVPKTVDVKMKIGSPSKVMEDYGKWTMEGFAIGAKNALPLVTDAMNGMSSTAMNAPIIGNASAPSAPATNTARIEQLLLILIQELRAKNMSANVTVAGGGQSLGGLVGFTAGLRGA